MSRIEIFKSIFGGLRVRYDCPQCGERLRSPLSDAGTQDVCPACRTQFLVPGSEQRYQLYKAKQSESVQKLKIAEQHQAESSSSRKAADDSGLGMNPFAHPNLVKSAAKLTKAIVDMGVLNFAEFIEKVTEKIGAHRTQVFMPVFEREWNAIYESGTVKGMEPAVKQTVEERLQKPLQKSSRSSKGGKRDDRKNSKFNKLITSYVNPIEILGLSNATDTTSINNEILKKAKRILFADIELSDNKVFEYYGVQLTKGDCEKAIDELSNNDSKEFYLYLANNKPLNEFLASGEEAIFKNFKQDSVFKLPEFVKFISPYFAPRFDRALLTAFENDNADLTKAILNTSSLIAQPDVNSAFKSVSNKIQNKIAEIDEITKDIKNEESVYDEDDIEDVVEIVKEHFPTNTLNCLPQYFQSQILKIADSINYLSNSILDAFDSTQVSNDLTEYLLTLNIGGLDRPTFENNFRIINERNNKRIEQAKNAPILKKWANILLKVRDAIKKVEDKTTNSNEAYQNIKDLFVLSELNALPSFADEIRRQIGYSIRSLSISIWNEQSDIKSALATINLALQINVDKEAKEKFRQDQTELSELEKKYRGVFFCYFCVTVHQHHWWNGG